MWDLLISLPRSIRILSDMSIPLIFPGYIYKKIYFFSLETILSFSLSFFLSLVEWNITRVMYIEYRGYSRIISWSLLSILKL